MPFPEIGRRAALGVLMSAASPAIASETREEWPDRARGRALPVLLRRPATPGPHPAVLLSHGLGGSREGLGYLGRALAEAGFVALHLQHPGSDSAVWQGRSDPFRGMQEAARDPRNAANRLLDVVFALDELPRRAPVDPSRVAAAGHSFGAWTVQHALGQGLPLPIPGIPERRLGAGILLSPVPPLFGAPEVAAIRAPLLHVTGTEDRTMVGAPAGPEERLALWRAIRGVRQAAAVFRGATHLAFAGREEFGAGGVGTGFHARTAALCLLFLRATLLADGEAAREIARGAPDALAPGDTLEVRDWG
ncbi:MAG: acetylhydrolase [Acetobacteraceae bacterium]|nr:acetylhydrolase [Acetobacteraceae bacterium]